MKKKEKLIKSLKVAVHALEADIVHYKWTEQSSCNCGVVSQAVLGISSLEIKKKIDSMITDLVEKKRDAKKIKEDEHAYDTTWKNMVKFNCSITGKTSVQILRDLQEAGLAMEDICHLEYLENPAILARTNIPITGIITERKKVGTKKVKTKTGLFSSKIEEVPIYEKVSRTVKNHLVPLYYSEKTNLIKYLKAWIGILEEASVEVKSDSTKQTMQEELLKAVSGEDYETAAKIRDRIAVTD